MKSLIKPIWPAPHRVKAFTTTRQSFGYRTSRGYSKTPYAKFNLATHVEDNLEDVTKNRALLKDQLQLPNQPVWLTQCHSNRVIYADQPSSLNADGAYTQQKNTICAILTADCLPILICNKDGTEVAALHGGWRGIANGIIETGIKKFQSNPEDILVWLGPAIGTSAFEVGKDVYDVFVKFDPQAKTAFQRIAEDHFLANIIELASQRLKNCGVTNIYNCDLCTYTDAKRFYSFRRDGETGRFANLIWIEDY